ncbi:ester cyclase, partial [Streptosporangium sp. NPDC006007]|uniref:ester cyclase n=1 Tax=Streptosporangium sp. NPDC006007 TaxID=3154575 RepID=UPI0033AE4F1B
MTFGEAGFLEAVDQAGGRSGGQTCQVRDFPRGAGAWFQGEQAGDLGPIVDGDLISARWTMRATYTGGIPQATAPVGTKISFSGNDILRVCDGRFVEYWTCADILDGLSQLGAISGPNRPWGTAVNAKRVIMDSMRAAGGSTAARRSGGA